MLFGKNITCSSDGGSEELMDRISQLDDDQLEELKRCITEAEQLRKDYDTPEAKERLDNDQD